MRFPRFLGFRAEPGDAVGKRADVGLDYHCHLLPGVDDGMTSLADSMATITAMQALGFSGAVLTPHIYRDVFDNDSAGLRAAFDAYRAVLAAEGVAFAVHLAAEYFADEHFMRLIEQDDLLALEVGDERWVLLEFAYMQETPFAGACLSALVARGYRPVIAHVERYRFVAQAPEDWLERFERAGAVLQGDIGSLVGQFGEETRRFALWLEERGKIVIWGTDVHHPGQIGRHIVPGLARLRGAGRLNQALDGVTA